MSKRPTSRALRVGATVVAASGLWLAGSALGSGDDRAWERVPLRGLAGRQTKQYEAAVAARDAMAAELMRALGEQLGSAGPAAAIAVCRDRAPEIAAATAARFRVAIGRTSFRLRNPANAPPPWAVRLLEDQPDEPRFAESPDGRLGATFPIRLAAPCVTCHGPAEAIPEDVRKTLAALYPDDKATGFREGDVRGWFWVEVPPPVEPPPRG